MLSSAKMLILSCSVAAEPLELLFRKAQEAINLQPTYQSDDVKATKVKVYVRT